MKYSLLNKVRCNRKSCRVNSDVREATGCPPLSSYTRIIQISESFSQAKVGKEEAKERSIARLHLDDTKYKITNPATARRENGLHLKVIRNAEIRLLPSFFIFLSTIYIKRKI